MEEINIEKISCRFKAMSNALFKIKWLKSNMKWLTSGYGGHLKRICLGIWDSEGIISELGA